MRTLCAISRPLLAMLLAFSWSAAAHSAGTKLWEYVVDGFMTSSASLGPDGTIYIASAKSLLTDGTLHAVSANGMRRWTFDVAGRINAPPAVGTNGVMYFGSFEGKLYALNEDGSKQWEFTPVVKSGFETRIAATPAIGADGTIYIGAYALLNPGSGAGTGKFFAVNPDGTLKWWFAVGEKIYAGAAIGRDGAVYFGSLDGNFYALGPNGTLEWKIPGIGGSLSQPAIDQDGTIYIGGPPGLVAIHPHGRIKWGFETPSTHFSPTIGTDGTVYIACQGGFFAVSRDGLPKAENRNAYVAGSPTVGSDGTIYCAFGGRLAALYLNGATKWFSVTLATTAELSPVITVDGTVYVPGERSMYAVKGECGLASSPWPIMCGSVSRRFLSEIPSEVVPCLHGLRLSRIQGFHFTLTGQLGRTYAIEGSENLLTWTPLLETVCTNGIVDLTDEAATNIVRRWYRAVAR